MLEFKLIDDFCLFYLKFKIQLFKSKIFSFLWYNIGIMVEKSKFYSPNFFDLFFMVSILIINGFNIIDYYDTSRDTGLRSATVLFR